MGAFPKDSDLIQAENAWVCLKSLKRPIVREGGIYVIATAASEGLGRHGLFDPTGVSYRQPQEKRALKGRPVWYYAPGVREEQARQFIWEGYPLHDDPRQLIRELEAALPRQARVAAVPCATMQQLYVKQQD